MSEALSDLKTKEPKYAQNVNGYVSTNNCVYLLTNTLPKTSKSIQILGHVELCSAVLSVIQCFLLFF